MRYIKLIFSEFYLANKKSFAITTVIYITVVISFLSMFISMRVLEQNASKYENINKAKATYSNILIESETYASLSDFILAVEYLMEDAVAVENPVLSFKDAYTSIYMEGFEMGLGYNCYLKSKDEKIVNIFDNKILQGRDFTDEELENGDRVVIADDYNYYNNKKLNVGDTVKIYGEDFTVIGIGSNLYVPYKSVIKYIENYNGEISFAINNITYPKAFSAEKSREFHNIIKQKDLISDFERSENKNEEVLFNQILICVFIALLATVIIITLFKQVIRNQLNKIALFKVCGSKNSFVIILFIVQISLYLLISFFISVLAYFILNGSFVKLKLTQDFNISVYFITFIIVYLLTLIAVIPSVFKVSRQPPAKLEIRR